MNVFRRLNNVRSGLVLNLKMALRRVRTIILMVGAEWYFRFTSRLILIVATMGESGSTSIYKAAKNTPLPFGVFHLHFLSESIDGLEARHRRAAFLIRPTAQLSHESF